MEKRNRFFRTGIVAVCNVVILAVLLFFFFGGRDFSLEQKEDARLIGASYMTMNNEFYTIISEEAAYRVEAEGDRMILRDPALDPVRQASQIRELLDMGISALVVAPADADCLADVLTEARDRGVKVIVVDTAVADDIPADCTITSDNYEAGVIIGKYFLQKHNTAKLVVMTHESARSARERVGGFLDTVSANENIQVVKKIECEGQVEIAMPRLQEAIDEGLDFDTVFCLNDLAGMGVVAALDENGLLDQVAVYGVDASPDSKELIHEGKMAASAAQFPTVIGKEAADAIYRCFDGEETEKLILTPVKLICAENVEEFGISRWQ